MEGTFEINPMLILEGASCKTNGLHDAPKGKGRLKGGLDVSMLMARLSKDMEGWGADVSKPMGKPGRRGNVSIYGT